MAHTHTHTLQMFSNHRYRNGFRWKITCSRSNFLGLRVIWTGLGSKGNHIFHQRFPCPDENVVDDENMLRWNRWSRGKKTSTSILTLTSPWVLSRRITAFSLKASAISCCQQRHNLRNTRSRSPHLWGKNRWNWWASRIPSLQCIRCRTTASSSWKTSNWFWCLGNLSRIFRDGPLSLGGKPLLCEKKLLKIHAEILGWCAIPWADWKGGSSSITTAITRT